MWLLCIVWDICHMTKGCCVLALILILSVGEWKTMPCIPYKMIALKCKPSMQNMTCQEAVLLGWYIFHRDIDVYVFDKTHYSCTYIECIWDRTTGLLSYMAPYYAETFTTCKIAWCLCYCLRTSDRIFPMEQFQKISFHRPDFWYLFNMWYCLWIGQTILEWVKKWLTTYRQNTVYTVIYLY